MIEFIHCSTEIPPQITVFCIFIIPIVWDHLSILLEPVFPHVFPKSGDGMMLLQLFGSESIWFSSLGFAHNSHPLQLNPAAAIMIPSPIKNFFFLKKYDNYFLKKYLVYFYFAHLLLVLFLLF